MKSIPIAWFSQAMQSIRRRSEPTHVRQTRHIEVLMGEPELYFRTSD